VKTNLKYNYKVVSFLELNKKIINCSDKKIGFTNGCFDILHKGHYSLFKFCKKHCDILIVATNSDISIKELKGKKRPYNNLKTRLINLSNIKDVDYIIYFHKLNPLNLIKKIQPSILFKGSDYKIKDVIGREFVESYGGKTILVPYIIGISTSDILKKQTHI
tara:strand:- start:72 stop:557 length:486 start_codon:yes stop_codon:yes gene_type:complete